jgi:flagellar biogenesis protein FliO
LTRDANNGTLSSSADSPIAGGDRNDLPEEAARMAGFTAIVILVIVGGAFLLRKYNLVPVSETGASLASAKSAKTNATKGFAAAFLPSIGNMSASKGQPPKTTSPAQDLSDAMIGNGGLQIVGGQPLPGSGTIVYLVRIEDHLVLLGASYAGGVRLLAEWEKNDQPETEQEKARFDSFLREQGIAAEPVRDEKEEHTFATIRARLNSTAERLAGLRQEFGG